MKFPRRNKQQRQSPEDAIRLRQLTFAAQVTGLIALASVTQLWIVALLATLLLLAGHSYSCRARHHPGSIVRVGTFIALHLTFVWAAIGLFSGQVYPQAQLAMLAMGVVSFQLFSRLNLYSALGLGMVNLYVASTLSRDLSFGVYLLLYMGLLLAFLWIATTEDGLKSSADTTTSATPAVMLLKPVASDAHPHAARRYAVWILRSGLVLFVAATLIFLFLPHYLGSPLLAPIPLQFPIKSSASASVINPGLGLFQIQGQSEDGHYYGFDTNLDMTYRSVLPNTIVMDVRSPVADLWRARAYDEYNGHSWTLANDSLTHLKRNGRINIRLNKAVPDEATFMQSFFITAPMPNLVLSGGDPLDLYVPADEVAIDEADSIRIGQAFAPNMTYSVLAARKDESPAELRTVGIPYPFDVFLNNVQLPDGISERVRKLARDLTVNAPTPYDKAVILRDYLKATYPYDYFPPPQQVNTETVDQFLFVDKRGVCEQYVTALVIMLRTLHIPARLASGYGSGTLNPFTGFYEVHANDAHAWAEVYFPGHGWIAFDPTPGWVGDPRTGPVQKWAFSGLLDGLNLPPLPVAQIVQAGAAAINLLIVPVLTLAALALTLLLGLKGWRAWKQRQAKQPIRHWRGDSARQQIFAAYRQAQHTVKAYRQPAQTTQEHTAQNADFAVAFPDLADAVDAAAYNPQPPDPALLARLRGKGQDNR